MRISDWSSDVCSSDLTLAQDIDPRFYSRRIGHNRIAVVASKAMANSSNAPRTPDDLRGHTFLVHRAMPNAVNHWFEAQGLPVIRPVETIQLDRKSKRLNSSH